MTNYQKPKVIIVCGTNPITEGGGYGSYAYSLAKTLTSLKFKCEIFCCGKKAEIIESSVGRIHVIPSKILSLSVFANMPMAALLILAPKLALAIRNIIKEGQTIIWGVGPWSLAGVLLKIYFTKIIIFAHYATSLQHEFLGTLSALKISDYGIWARFNAYLVYYTIIKLYTLLERFILQNVDKIITHYKSTETILSSQYNIKPVRFYRLPYRVELTSRSHSGAEQSEAIESSNKDPIVASLLQDDNLPKPLILLVCRQDARKGINFLLHAFAILNNRGLHFSAMIVGKGKMLQLNRKLIKKLKLSNVLMPGFMADTSTILKKADLYVFPSLEEGNSAFSILEAMKKGLPIVSTNVDGIPEDLEDGKTAILVPPKDPQALADAIQKLLENPHLAKKLGQNAKKAYQNKYNLLKVRKEVRSFLTSLRRASGPVAISTKSRFPRRPAKGGTPRNDGYEIRDSFKLP